MEQKKSEVCGPLLLASTIVGFASWIGLFSIFIRHIINMGGLAAFFELSNLEIEGINVRAWLITDAIIMGILALSIVPSVLGLIAWKKDKKLLGGIAGVLYILTCNFVSAIMCVIGIRPRFLEGKKTLLFIAGYIGIVLVLLLGILTLSTMKDDPGSIAGMLYFLISLLLAIILNGIGWQKNSAKLTLAAAIIYIVSGFGIPSAVLCFIGRAQLKKKGA
jgi:hypothetical protein